MLQKNHHFLFPQTYFGPLEPLDDVLFDDEEEEDEISHVPWVLILEPEQPSQYDTKIGLHIHWIEPL